MKIEILKLFGVLFLSYFFGSHRGLSSRMIDSSSSSHTLPYEVQRDYPELGVVPYYGIRVYADEPLEEPDPEPRQRSIGVQTEGIGIVMFDNRFFDNYPLCQNLIISYFPTTIIYGVLQSTAPVSTLLCRILSSILSFIRCNVFILLSIIVMIQMCFWVKVNELMSDLLKKE